MTERISPEQLKQQVEKHIHDARVEVRLYAGDDHFEMKVVSPSFSGKSRVAQHQMVYAALGDHMRQAVHALVLKTSTTEIPD